MLYAIWELVSQFYSGTQSNKAVSTKNIPNYCCYRTETFQSKICHLKTFCIEMGIHQTKSNGYDWLQQGGDVQLSHKKKYHRKGNLNI